MPEAGPQICSVCGVKILKLVGGDRVLFAVGPPGTRALLWKRVCQYAQKPGCINPESVAEPPPSPPPL